MNENSDSKKKKKNAEFKGVVLIWSGHVVSLRISQTIKHNTLDKEFHELTLILLTRRRDIPEGISWKDSVIYGIKYYFWIRSILPKKKK